jgi:phosphoenolpyruvate carboxykinase (GTP)
MRVLKWMLDRLDGSGGGREHVFGVTPDHADLNWQGLDFTPAQFDAVTRIDAAEWQAEMKLHDELFAQLAHHLPAELPQTQARIQARLAELG